MLPARRYGALARYYDVLSGERLFYERGRRAAIDALRLRPGDRVLDVGCGTGLNFPLLVEAVGGSGEVVGIDASIAMLSRARRRIESSSWARVELVTADAGAIAGEVRGGFDAALFTYSLAIIKDWRSAWRQALALTRPGGRVSVVDTAAPTGVWSLLTPASWLVFAVGGVHPGRRVWQLVAAETDDSAHRTLVGGHIHVSAGTVRDCAEITGDRSAGSR